MKARAKYIALGQPAHLPVADHVHRFVPVNCVQRSLDRTEAETRRDALFDETVILFHYVIQIGTPPIAAAAS